MSSLDPFYACCWLQCCSIKQASCDYFRMPYKFSLESVTIISRQLKALLTLLFVINFHYAAIADQPNIIFILADDCTYKDLELYGGQAKTPNLNTLAKQGLKFNRCYQSASMCAPTRHALYTGLYPMKSGAYPNHGSAYPHIKSAAHYMGDLGYRVILAGKKHIDPMSVFPFEEIQEFADPYREDVSLVDGWRYPKIFKALQQAASKSGDPVCMFLNSNEPHGPYTKGDPNLYPKDKLKITPQIQNYNLEQYSKYLAEITYFDGQVGEIMRMLDALDLAQNTLLIVATEQGSSFPFAKWTCYEMGVASGLVIRWPERLALEAGQTRDQIVEYTDILPTMIAAAGGSQPFVLDGQSLLPVLLGQVDQFKEYAYSLQVTNGVNGNKFPYGIRSVVNDRYRYIRNLFPENEFSIPASRRALQMALDSGNEESISDARRFLKRPAEELYDIISDPYCETNLIDRVELNSVKSELSSSLDRWMKSQGDLGIQAEHAAYEHQADWRKNQQKH